MPHSIFSVRKLLLALLVGILATSLSGRIFAEKVVEAVTNMPIENAFVVRHWMGHRPEHTYCASTSFAVTDARGKFSMPTSVYRMFNQEQHLYVYKPGYRELYLVGMQRSGSSAQEPDPSITPLSKQDYLKAVDAQADSMRGNIVMAKDISSASKRLSYLADRARLGACTGSGEEQLELVPF